jgi:hypothetical protein
MFRKTASEIVCALLIVSVLMLTFKVQPVESSDSGQLFLSFESANNDATSSNLGFINVMDDGLGIINVYSSLPCDLLVPPGRYYLWYSPSVYNPDLTFVRWETSAGIIVENSSSPRTEVNISDSGFIKALYTGPAPSRIYGQQIEVGTYPFSTLNASIGSTFSAEILAVNWSFTNVYSFQLKVWYDNVLLEAINASISQNHFLTPKLDPGNIFVVDPGTINQQAGCVSFAASLQGNEPGSKGDGVLAAIVFKISKKPSTNESLSCNLGLQGVVLVDPATNRIPSNLYEIVNGHFSIEWETFPTDLNRDGKVDIQDITIVGVAYGSRTGASNWNVLADLDKNGIINILDIAAVAKDYGKTV